MHVGPKNLSPSESSLAWTSIISDARCRLAVLLVFSSLFLLTGCKKWKQEAQWDDSRNPYYQQAQQDLTNGNLNDALQAYQTALALNPKLAGAHYALGQIYGDRLNDPISAIYHFKRFLELNPPPDKAQEVKALIDRLSLSFAASLPNSPVQNAQIYAELQSQNTDFRRQLNEEARTIGQLRAQLPSAPTPPSTVTTAVVAPESTVTSPTPEIASPSTLPPAPPVLTTPAAPGVTPTPVSASGPAPRTYKVASGDSLWKIAHKMYPGDTRNGMAKIQDANKDTLPDPKALKIGQVLVIP